MHGTHDTVSGEVVQWLTQPKAESGWLVAELKVANGGRVIATGCALPRPGAAVELWGRFETHPRFGQQFKVHTVQRSTPAVSAVGVERWLAERVHGIGPKTAASLLESFGGAAQLWSAAERGADALTERGVKPELAQGIADAIAHEGEGARYQSLLQGWGMTQNQVARVQKHWSLDEATRLLGANPYLLCDHVDGFGFARADKVALASGVMHNAPVRVNAAVLHHMQQAAGQGHVYANRAVFGAIARVAQLPMERLAAAARSLAEAGRVVVESADDADRVYLAPLHEAECAVAHDLVERFGTTAQPATLPPKTLDPQLTMQQCAAVALMTDPSRRVVFVTGGPGTGKTTILRAALGVFAERDITVQLAAPTGKAAKRMQQATGRTAMTLHRLLGYKPGNGAPDCDTCAAAEAEFDFAQFDRCNPRVVIVDESSMVDLELWAALVARAGVCRLVFVGDHNQLPPVGPGQPFQDALVAAPPHCRAQLTQVHRSKDTWVNVAAPLVLAGKMPALEPSPSFRFFEARSADDVVPTLRRLVNGELNTDGFRFAEIEAACGAAPVVLSPQRRGAAGVAALNQWLHEHVNPAEPDALGIELEDKTVLREGSWVMFQRNNRKTGVCNGDTGRVLQALPMANDPHKAGRLVIAVDADSEAVEGAAVEVPASEARSHVRLAYASTIHKAQGMEYPWVIVIAHSSHARMLTRRLLYTAITRAKLGVIVIGDREGIELAVANAREAARNTGLTGRLVALAKEWP